MSFCEGEEAPAGGGSTFFTGKKVFTAEKRLQQLQHSSRTCFDLDQTERFFFRSRYPRVKFEVEFAARSRLVSLISLLRPFCGALTRLECKCCHGVVGDGSFGNPPWRIGSRQHGVSWQTDTEEEKKNTHPIASVCLLCVEGLTVVKELHTESVRNINRISGVI